MTRVNGTTIGRWSLRLDAAYCAVLGIAVALWAGPIAQGVRLPELVIAAVGIAVAAWAGAVLWMVQRVPLRRALRFVMIANIVAATVVAAISVTAATFLVVLAVIAIAIDIGLFAASQAVALGALRARS